jgi:thiamine-monophosphate kinase
LSEFDLIRRFFSAAGSRRADVALGVGDDCALLRVPPGLELAVSIDTLVAGVHFFSDCDSAGLGHKSLAVGLSDLASMGAEPAWATLALTLPRADSDWISAFASGFSDLAVRTGVALVGGDTTRGPLTISVQVQGFVPAGQAIIRGGARPGDLVCVSGTLGDAGLALRGLREGTTVSAYLRGRLERPSPRVALGLALRGLATAAIDVSDGLAADLGHVLGQSGVGAEIELDSLPLSPEVARFLDEDGDWDLPLACGDDYELCFTLPPDRLGELDRIAKACRCPLRVLGRIVPGARADFLLADGRAWRTARTGFDHFPG